MAVGNRVRHQLLVDLIRLAPRSPGNHTRHTERRQIANGEMDATVGKIGEGIVTIAVSALHAQRVVGHRNSIAVMDLSAADKHLAVFLPHRVIETERRRRVAEAHNHAVVVVASPVPHRMGTQDIGSKVNRSNATLAGGGVDKRAVADTKLIHPAVFSMSLWGKAGAVARLGLRLGDHRGPRSRQSCSGKKSSSFHWIIFFHFSRS